MDTPITTIKDVLTELHTWFEDPEGTMSIHVESKDGVLKYRLTYFLDKETASSMWRYCRGDGSSILDAVEHLQNTAWTLRRQGFFIW